MSRGAGFVAVCLLVAALGGPADSCAQSFVIEPAIAPGLSNTIFNPGGVGGAPAPPVYISGIVPPLVIDAISYSRPLADLGYAHVFSVSPVSLGAAATDVANEAAFGEQPADIFTSSGGGTNSMLFDGNGIAAPTGLTAAPLGIFESTPPNNNVNAFDMRSASPSGSIYFSVDPASAGAYGGPPAGEPGNVYVAPAAPLYDTFVPAVYATSALLGLTSADDIDALVVFEDGLAGFTAGDVVRFSLAPGSPSLVGFGASPADIIDVTGPGGIPAIVATAASLGLLATDDVDSLDVLVPEPGAGLLLALGGLLAGLWFRRSRRTAGR